MEPHALAPYAHSLSTGTALQLAHDDGRTRELDVARWLGRPDAADRSVVARARGRSLDVGCGPGRIVEALTQARRFALGVDIAPEAVALTRARGQNALCVDVFDPLPGEGAWGCALLLDGNIGIGGDPERLLHRMRELIAPDGAVLVEAHADDAADESGRVRFAIGGTPIGPSFAWSVVGTHALLRAADACGFAVRTRWVHSERRFVELSVGTPR